MNRYEFSEPMPHNGPVWVKIVDRHTLAAHLDSIGHFVDPDTIDAVLRGLIELQQREGDRNG